MNEQAQEAPEIVSTDQTAFGSTVPLFENQSEVLDPLAPPPKESTPIWKKPLVLVGGSLGLIAILLMIVVSSLQPNSSQRVIIPSPSPTTNVQSGPWQTRVTALQAELKAADPAQQELPFPPVKMNLPLESSSR